MHLFVQLQCMYTRPVIDFGGLLHMSVLTRKCLLSEVQNEGFPKTLLKRKINTGKTKNTIHIISETILKIFLGDPVCTIILPNTTFARFERCIGKPEWHFDNWDH